MAMTSASFFFYPHWQQTEGSKSVAAVASAPRIESTQSKLMFICELIVCG